MTDFTEFQKDPELLTKFDLHELVRDLIALICNAADSPDQLGALLICREALSSDIGNLSDNQLALLNAVWIGLTSRENGISSLRSCCFLLDRLISCPEIADQLKSNGNIVNCLQTNLLVEGPNRKYVYHILRTIRDPEKCSAWQSFFVIFDTLAEKQSHLIVPVLELLDQTEALPDQWHQTLLAHALTISNNPVIRKVIQFILRKSHKQNYLSTGMIAFQERFLNSLNTNFLYASDDPIDTNGLRNYFQRLSGDLIDRNLEIIFTINWKSVPLFYLCDSLVGQLSPMDLPRFTKLAEKIPHCGLRKLILQKLIRFTVKSDDEGLLFKGRLTINSYEAQKRDMQTVCSSLKLDLNLEPSSVSESLLEIIASKVNSLTTKYYPEIDPTDPKMIRTITQNLFAHNDWLLPLGNPSIDKLLAAIGLTKRGYFEGELSVLASSVLVHRLSSVDWSSRFVTSLIDYELQMALQILAVNIDRLPIGERVDILDSCLVEVQSTKNTHLVGSFVLVLDKLMDQDPLFGDTHRMYYEKAVQLAPNHPKWMVVLSSHRQLWSFAANNSEFMAAALTFGQAMKGDQLIEEQLSLTDASSPDCSVRNSALLHLYSLPSDTTRSHTSLLQSCFEQLKHLGSRKSRYYANSETHRLKLRLVQAVAILSSRIPNWDDHLETMLLTENNQLNVTYIVELLVGHTVEPTRLLNMLAKTSTPNARRSVFMCMFYLSRQSRCTADIVDQFIRTILVWSMGKDYGTRLFAQIVVLKLLKTSPVAYNNILIDTIQQSLNLVDNQKDVERLTNDFRFHIDASRLCDFGLVLHTIPTLTKMCFLEIFRRDLLVKWPELNEHKLLDVSRIESLEQSTVIEPLVRTELIQLNVGNVQKKIVPLKELFPIDTNQSNHQRQETKEGLIVVASLISRAANLGGLSRTCEIFGAEKLVIDSLRHTEAADFQALSMTAEKWLRIAEVKPFHLVDYLVEMKCRGYAIIGAEQTANGISIRKLEFPKKSVLLLGHEKEGIPANLLSLLDQAVEIPQFGVVRSLNVHVTGALFIWEYAKQHNNFV